MVRPTDLGWAVSRSELALELESIFAEKAKEQQKEHKNTAPGKPKSLVPTLAQVIGNPKKTRDKVAKLAAVSHGTIDKAKYIRDNASEDTKEKLRAGANDVSINKVFQEAKRKEKEEIREQKRIVNWQREASVPEKVSHLFRIGDVFEKIGYITVQSLT